MVVAWLERRFICRRSGKSLFAFWDPEQAERAEGWWVGGMSGGDCVGVCFKKGFGYAFHRHPFSTKNDVIFWKRTFHEKEGKVSGMGSNLLPLKPLKPLMYESGD
jgi:hypothetical protein